MRAVAVVMLDELVDHGVEVTPAEDQHAIEALPSDGADEALRERIGTRGPDRRADDADVLGAEDLIEAGGELGVPISNQELHRSC